MRRRDFIASALVVPGVLKGQGDVKQYYDEIDQLLYDSQETPEGLTDKGLKRLKEIFGHFTPEELTKFHTQYDGKAGEAPLVIPVFIDIIKIRNDRIKARLTDKKTLSDNKQNYVELLRFMLDKGMDIDAQSTPLKATALHNAVYENDREVFDLLVERKANPNLQDVFGDTALHYAYTQKNQYMIDSLLNKAKANPAIRNRNGKTPGELSPPSPGTRIA